MINLFCQVNTTIDSNNSMVMADGLMDNIPIDPLVANLGFSASSSLASHSHQRPPLPISPPTHPVSPPSHAISPAPISPPLASISSAVQKAPSQHSTLDPNARVYTPKGVANSDWGRSPGKRPRPAASLAGSPESSFSAPQNKFFVPTTNFF